MTTDALDALSAENRRLQRDVRLLRERVQAFEDSRWHRLNPRNLLRGRRSTSRVEDEPARSPAATEDGPPPDVVRFRDEVVSRGAFGEDWLTAHLGPWQPLLGRLEAREARILEIGSYEGLSACYLLWRLPDATITCIDPFAMSEEATFDANVALLGASRVHKLVADSRRVLPDLVADGSQFDLVYVDGSHLGLDVLVDAALSWQVLKPGGDLVFDDYAFYDRGEDALLRPGPAIDAFLSMIEGKYEELFRGYQLAVRKLPV